MEYLEDIVEKLLAKAAKTDSSQEALRFSQAALNAAHTRHALVKYGQPQN